MLTHITANISGSIRNDTMEGRDYMVVPMIMIVEGVLDGSGGPILYPGDELEKTPGIWNYKPVVVQHPKDGDELVSACDPEVITERKIGVIMNTVYEDGKLKAEAWLESSRVTEVDDRVMDAITQNQTMELSTGLYADADETSGEFGGVAYDGIARNIRPDHLALLPDDVGACSIAAGAGFFRVNQRSEKCPVSKSFVKTYAPILDAVGLDFSKVLDNELSYGTVRDALSSQMNESAQEGKWVFIEEVYPDFFIYEIDSTLYKQTYTKTADVVEIGSAPAVEVQRVVEYRSMASGAFVGNIHGKELNMNKEQMIAALIANKNCVFGEDDKDMLTNMTEDALKKLDEQVQNAGGTEETAAADEQEAEDKGDAAETPAETPADAPVANKAQTVKEYIAAAPAPLQEVLQNGLNSYQADHQRFIDAILANERNTYTKEELEAKNLKDLQSLAALAGESVTSPAVPLANFAGQGETVQNTSHTEEALTAPTMDFDDD
jgi:hypothetical protein